MKKLNYFNSPVNLLIYPPNRIVRIDNLLLYKQVGALLYTSRSLRPHINMQEVCSPSIEIDSLKSECRVIFAQSAN